MTTGIVFPHEFEKYGAVGARCRVCSRSDKDPIHDLSSVCVLDRYIATPPPLQSPPVDAHSANTRQVGGSHYKTGGEEHWDRIWRLYGRGYFVGCITKYVERYHKKAGIQDLEKAKHFLEKLIELESGPTAGEPTGYVKQD